jgi:hypothetical protein
VTDTPSKIKLILSLMSWSFLGILYFCSTFTYVMEEKIILSSSGRKLRLCVSLFCNRTWNTSNPRSWNLYSCENSIALLTHIQRSTASRAILPFVKQWIVFNTCNINNYILHYKSRKFTFMREVFKWPRRSVSVTEAI